MSLSRKLDTFTACVTNLVCRPHESIRRLAGPLEVTRGADFVRTTPAAASVPPLPAGDDDDDDRRAAPNPLRTYFDGVKQGPGVWKWLHYFPIYHRHLQKFVGRPVTVAEVGVYSGGSLSMWRSYFGEACRIHGVDIQPECKVYENAQTSIHIGDQTDRLFWKRFRDAVPALDILIDDGGHKPEQQMVTLEETFRHLRPGGVYICEDVWGAANRFAAFAHSLSAELNRFDRRSEEELDSAATPFQAAVDSVHLYPFVVVIEKRDAPLPLFEAPKHGTQWQPFL